MYLNISEKPKFIALVISIGSCSLNSKEINIHSTQTISFYNESRIPQEDVLSPQSQINKKQLAQKITAENLISHLKKQISERSVKEFPNQEAYFMIPFSYENKEQSASGSHTFFTFVKVDSTGQQHWKTISWLPEEFEKTRRIDVFLTFAEAAAGNIYPSVKGKSYNLEDTLRFAKDAGFFIDVFSSGGGPVNISREFYEHEIDRFEELKSGKKRYLAQDFETRISENAFNCMHAVSDIAGYYSPRGALGTGWGIWGFKGTQHVLDHLSSINGWLRENIKSTDRYILF